MQRLIAVAAVVSLAGAALAAGAPNDPPSGLPSGPQGSRGPKVPNFWVRSGYRVTLAVENIDNPRFLEFDDKGTLYVSQPGRGSITALRDKDGDGVYETSAEFVGGKTTVHGLDWHDGWLWFTQSGAIYKGRDTNSDGKADDVVTVIPDGQLPKGAGHWWRPIAVDNDGFYTAIGDDKNFNEHTDDERSKIYHFNLDGSGKKLFASGLRNTEKLGFRPGTNELWGADHASDNFGATLEGNYKPAEGLKSNKPLTDFLPPEEFNHYVEGGFYGHPYVMGNKVPRLEYLQRPDILDLVNRTIPAAWNLPAHWAPNGWTFLSKATFPGQQGNAWIAAHGSSNSSVKVGYCVEAVLFDLATGNPYGSQMIVGMLDDKGNNLDRPVDCAEAPDGTVFVSCDSRRIFRISRDK